MTRTGIGCGLGKTLQQEPNARGINSREPCAMTPNPRLERAVNGLAGRPRAHIAILRSRRAGRARVRPLKLIVRHSVLG